MPRDYGMKGLQHISRPHRVVDRPLETEEKVEEEVDCDSVLALDVPLLITGNLSFPEDEMMSWLMYPFEDAFDQQHGPELLGDFTNPHLHLVKDAFINQNLKESEIKANGHDSTRIDIDAHEVVSTCNDSKRFSPDSRSPPRQNDELKSVYLDAHGFEKANDDMKRFGPRVDGIGKGTSNARKLHDCRSHSLERTSNNPKRLDLSSGGLSTHRVSSVEFSLRNKDGSASNSLLLEERRVSSHHPYEPQNNEMQYTFPLFSRPVAATRDSLRILGSESGPRNIERVRKTLSTDLIASSEVSLPILFSDSNTNNQENEQLSEVKKTLQQSDITCLKSSLSDDFKDTEQSMGCISEQLELNRSSDSEHDHFSKEDKITSQFDCSTVHSEHGTRMVEIASSSSIVSGSVILSPARFCGNEQSQDVKDVGATKKTSSHLKRIRAAETHNESEKRRRNRINIKLKALQDLIPNSTKTDKASVLDDAIQYLKFLQAQVQLMTTRSNSVYPPVMMLPGLQHVPMHGMSTLPHMGQPLQAYHGVQILHALAPMAQPHLAYLPTAMVHMPSHSVMGTNTMPMQ